jgi:hypothetical protein
MTWPQIVTKRDTEMVNRCYFIIKWFHVHATWAQYVIVISNVNGIVCMF